MKRSKRRVGSRKKRRVGNRILKSSYNRYNRFLEKRNKKQPWYKRMFSSKKKVKRVPGQIVKNVLGQPKLCYKNVHSRNIQPTGPDNCDKDNGEFCNVKAPGGGPFFCYYEFSTKQIKKGRKELEQWNKLRSEMTRQRQTTSKLAVLGKNKSKRRRFRK